MKQKLFTLLLAVAASIGAAFASVTINGIAYELKGTTATVVNGGNYTGTIVIPASVTYNGTTYSVTSIGIRAFKYCSGLTSVTIPNSVTSIGREAFAECTGLTSVTIPNSVTGIGQDAFSGCTGLTSPVYNAHVFAYMPTSYSGAYTIPDGIESIADGAFSGCTGLTSVTIGNSVTTIGWYAFSGCTRLTSVTIGNSVTNIGRQAFENCNNLTSITIPNSVTSIGVQAFWLCSGLTSVTIGNSVTSLGDDDAFDECNNITSVIWNAKNCAAYNFGRQVKTFAFGNEVEVIPEGLCEGMTKLTSITIPNSVTSIGSGAFNYCSGLTKVNITDIAAWCNIAFSGSSSNPLYYAEHLYVNDVEVTDLVIPNSVTSIGNYAFYDCSGLTFVTIPNSVTSIGDGAFDGCTGLTSVTIEAETPPTLGSGAFDYTNDCPIYVPCGTIDAYKTAWGITRITHSPSSACIYSISTSSSNPVWGTTSGDKSSLYLENVVISATANYGYHFVKWNDNNTENPRTVSVTEDKTFTATFAKNVYSITTNAEHGSISGNSSAEYLDEVTLSVSADYGYHFAQWSDGNTDNPRTIILTQDTTFTAEFVKNTYTISTTSNNSEWGTTAGDKSSLYMENVVISATANYGYHFVKWNDNNTENPRTISVTKDATYTATFAKNTYSITKIANSTQGSISGSSKAEYLDNVTLTATPQDGYHFTQWSDGIITNPRTFVLTQDTTFTAEFAKNTYTISTTSANPEWGTTSGDKSSLYMENVVISATANYGYHFVKWNDNNTENPRTISVTKDATYTATFAKNTYSITKNANSTQGSISGVSNAEYLDNVTLTVNPNYGYHFTQWNDGNTDNPRTFVLTQDTTFTAEFAVDKSGTCGKDNLLQWTFADDGTLTISGSGELTENYTFGVEAPTQMQQLVIGNEVTSIGERAFYEKTTLQKLIIGSNVTSIGKYAFASINNRQFTSLVMPAELLTIGDYAFSGNTYLESIDFNAKLQSIGAYAFKDCYRVSEMTCLATVTPDLGTDALASINSYASLCVPAECLRKYQVDPNWGRFDLCELGTTSTVTENRTVTVETTDNTAIFTWPTENNAASYSLQITKDGVVFCTLVFNSNGQLTGIAFAPGRNGAAHAPAATMSVAGMSFTVTGLDGASKYAYRLAVTNDASEELVAYSGEFATTGYTGEVNPGGNPEGIEDVSSSLQGGDRGRLILYNGQIFILRGDKTYTVTGAEVR